MDLNFIEDTIEDKWDMTQWAAAAAAAWTEVN